MLNPNACPEPEHGATTGQRADWRQRQLEVINAAADYVACGGRGVALLAAIAVLTDAYGVRGRSSFQPLKSGDDSVSDGKGAADPGQGSEPFSVCRMPYVHQARRGSVSGLAEEDMTAVLR